MDVELIDEEQVRAIDPNVKTFKKGLFSPTTSTVDPTQICLCLKNELVSSGVTFMFNESYKSHLNPLTIITNQGKAIIAKKKIINCAGLYADKIAREYGFSKNYIIIPFKGIYLKYTGEKKLLSTNVYPVPNLNIPFLGVHYTVTVDDVVKIKPTAIPAFWRENYSGMAHFSVHHRYSREYNCVVFNRSFTLFIFKSLIQYGVSGFFFAFYFIIYVYIFQI